MPRSTLPAVAEEYSGRRLPFAVAAIVVTIVSVALVRLPESFVNSLERGRPLTTPQAGWAYRLLAVAAIGQALYGGFVVLRVDHVKRARDRDAKVAAMTHKATVTSLSRNAAGMVVLTLIYGVASFAVTGQRGGYWLFPVLCLLQGAWYFRDIGRIARWLAFQPEAKPGTVPALWEREPPDYCPPLARALAVRTEPESGDAAKSQSA